ncbi:ABC transporter substrate-binding protein [Nitrospirillum sp. BR 11164]|uniref:ABC transporter substrate-binding protein n=1 Tax=Nitrospirillum sp. BR 11164 TaxID=3104324 RepID=UPI002B0018FD|nr:ABC transporter substrate-binding protein [Nitrospirillum sp. BR 11164]MEA1647603.1 ABC transporter substrate-binding protein [Nitrospirillum sp. BR 11164]
MFDIGFLRAGLRRRVRVLWVIAIIGVAMGQALAATGDVGETGKPVTTAVIASWPIDFHPLTGNELGQFAVKRFVTRPVLDRFDGDLHCVFCTKIPSAADGTLVVSRRSDGGQVTTATYALIPHSLWDDGSEITTQDLAFSWDVLRAGGRDLVAGDSRRLNIKDLHIIDKYRFSITYDGAVCGEQLDVPPPLPAHLERSIWLADPAHYFERSLYRTQPAHAGLYNGPFRVERIGTDSLQVVKNGRWSGQAAVFGRMNVMVAANQGDLEQKVRAGGVDIFSTLTFDVGQRLAHEFGDRYNAFYSPSAHLVHLKVNFDNPILSDLRVRKALLHGLNREELIATLLENKGVVAQGLLSPFMPGYAAVTRYAYNPQKSAALLDSAGWVKGTDGLRHNRAGAPLRFELRYRRNYPWIDLAPRLAAAWQNIGVQVDLIEDPQLSGDALDTRQRYLGLVGFAQGFEEGWEATRTWYHSAMIPAASNNWQGNNHFGIHVPALDETLDKLIAAGCNPDARGTALSELQQVYAENLPTLPLWFGTVITLSDKRLTGTIDRRTSAMAPPEFWRPHS